MYRFRTTVAVKSSLARIDEHPVSSNAFVCFPWKFPINLQLEYIQSFPFSTVKILIPSNGKHQAITDHSCMAPSLSLHFWSLSPLFRILFNIEYNHGVRCGFSFSLSTHDHNRFPPLHFLDSQLLPTHDGIAIRQQAEEFLDLPLRLFVLCQVGKDKNRQGCVLFHGTCVCHNKQANEQRDGPPPLDRGFMWL